MTVELGLKMVRNIMFGEEKAAEQMCRRIKMEEKKMEEIREEKKTKREATGKKRKKRNDNDIRKNYDRKRKRVEIEDGTSDMYRKLNVEEEDKVETEEDKEYFNAVNNVK
jgi:predicted transcriptional regulator